MSCGGGCRRGSDLALLWLWHRLAAVAPMRPLAWEPPYAMGTTLEKTNKTKQNKKIVFVKLVLCARVLHGIRDVILTTLQGECLYALHFTGEETKAQNIQITCPKITDL